MTARHLEALLARLYTDDALRREFVERPEAVARAAGLDEDSVKRLSEMDLDGLALAAHSFAAKRQAHAGRRAGPLSRWYAWLRR